MLIVDAANVIGSRPDGWWRDRAGAAARFLERLRATVDDGRIEPPVVVVLEGQARAGVADGEAGGVAVVHAAGSGDDAIVAVAEAAVAEAAVADLAAGAAGAADADAGAEAGSDSLVVVVTADRGLASRVRGIGGDVVGPRWLLDRLDG